MARIVRQTLPEPPAVYDQAYIAQLANAVNRYMIQRESGELTAARLVLTSPPTIGAATAAYPNALPDARTLSTGTLYLIDPATAPAATRFLTVVTPQDPL
jgi:hypothetical protein